MKSIARLLWFIMWVGGAVIAKGFWSTFFVVVTLGWWSFYLVVERVMLAYSL